MTRTRSVAIAVAVTAAIAWGGLSTLLRAAPSEGTPVYTSKARFRIPFRFDPAEMKALGAREVRLYQSDDSGESWSQTQTVAPAAGKFSFVAPSDGEYWFIVRTLDGRGRLHPDESTTDPGLKVVVDSEEPSLSLELQAAGPGRVLLKWSASDEHLDLSSLRLEYIQPGASGWSSISIVPSESGEVEWSAPRGGVVAVRGSVSDFAKNSVQSEKRVVVEPSSDTDPPHRQPDFTKPTAMGPSFPTPRMIVPPPPKEKFADEPAATAKSQGNSGLFAPAPSSDLASLPAPGAASSAATSAPPVSEPRDNSPLVATESDSTGFSAREIRGTANDVLPRTRFAEATVPAIRPAGRIGPLVHSTVPTAPPSFQTISSSSSTPSKTAKARVVGTKRFNLAYKLQDVGPSGVSKLHVYITQDGGKTWYDYGVDEDLTSPAAIDVPNEGTYGFVLTAESGAGLAAVPPQSGDRPAVSVIVDQTAPEVEFLSPEQIRSTAGGQLLFRWKYSDSHPADRPVALSYAENSTGPWQPLSGWIAAADHFAWTLPNNAPRRLYFKLEARDAAGNTRTVESTQPLVIDLSRPSVNIVDVETEDDAPTP